MHSRYNRMLRASLLVYMSILWLDIFCVQRYARQTKPAVPCGTSVFCVLLRLMSLCRFVRHSVPDVFIWRCKPRTRTLGSLFNVWMLIKHRLTPLWFERSGVGSPGHEISETPNTQRIGHSAIYVFACEWEAKASSEASECEALQTPFGRKRRSR